MGKAPSRKSTDASKVGEFNKLQIFQSLDVDRLCFDADLPGPQQPPLHLNMSGSAGKPAPVLSLVSWRPLYPHTLRGFASYAREKTSWWVKAISWIRNNRSSPAVLAALPGLDNENRIPSILVLEKHLVHFALYKLRYPICPGELQLEADTRMTDLCKVCWRHHPPSEAFSRHQNVWTLDTMELAMRRKWHEDLERKVKQPLIDEHREVDLARLTDRRQLGRLLQVDDTADEELRETGAGVYLGEWFYQKHKVAQQQLQQTGVVMPSSSSMPIAISTPVPVPSAMSNSHSAPVLSRVWTPISIAMPNATTASASTSAFTAKPAVFLQSPKLAPTSTPDLAPNTTLTPTPFASPTRPAASRPSPPLGAPKMPAAMLLTSRGRSYDDNPNLIVSAGPSRYSSKPPSPQLDPVEKVLSALTASHRKRDESSLTAPPDIRIEAPLRTPPPSPPTMEVTTRPDEVMIDPSLVAIGGGGTLIKPEKPAPTTPSKRVPDDPRAKEKKNRVVPFHTTTNGKSLGLLGMYNDDDAEEANDPGGSDAPMLEDHANEADIRAASDDIRAMTVDREDSVISAPLSPSLEALTMPDGVSGGEAMKLVMNFIAESQKCEAELKKVKAQYEGDKTIWIEKEQEYRDRSKKMEAENKRLRRERNSARDDWKVSEADRVRFKNKLEHAVADKADLDEQVRGLREKLAAQA